MVPSVPEENTVSDHNNPIEPDIGGSKAGNKRILFTSIICVILVVITGGISYYLGFRSAQSRNATIIDADQNDSVGLVPEETPTQVIVPTPTYGPFPEVRDGFKQHINTNFRYGFHYLDTDSVQACPSVWCEGIHGESVFIHINVLHLNDLPSGDPIQNLTYANIYCSGDGPLESLQCENPVVEPYTNTSGFEGYRVSLTRKFIRFRNGVETTECKDDVAYVFYFPDPIQVEGYPWPFVAVQFYPDEATEENFKAIDAIADSFFTF